MLYYILYQWELNIKQTINSEQNLWDLDSCFFSVKISHIKELFSINILQTISLPRINVTPLDAQIHEKNHPHQCLRKVLSFCWG